MDKTQIQAELTTLHLERDMRQMAEARNAELLVELAASQTREKQLREALDVLVFQHHDWCLGDVCSATFAQQNRELIQNARKVLALPQDTSTLEVLITKAGEVMRERCIAILKDPAVCSSNFEFETWVRALPGVTLEDLQK